MGKFTKHLSFYIPEAPLQILARRLGFLIELFHDFLLFLKANAKIGHVRLLLHLCQFVSRVPALSIESVNDKPRMNK
jgi:hypothetical protein